MTDLVIREATPDEHVASTPVSPAFTASAYAMFSVAKKSCDGVRWPHTGDSQGVACPEHLSCIPFFLKEQQDYLVPFRFREVWHVQLSPGQRARNSQADEPVVVQSELGPATKAVQTLRGQSVETGIQLNIVIIFGQFLM